MRRLILVGNLQEVTWGAFDSTLPNLPTIPNLAIPFCLNQMETAHNCTGSWFSRQEQSRDTANVKGILP